MQVFKYFHHTEETNAHPGAEQRRNLRQKGFTLVEVVAVTAMIGVLSAMLLPSVEGANNKAKNAKLKSDLVTIDNALALYRLENGKYPSALQDLKPDYLQKNKEFKDAMGEDISYTGNTTTYTLSGKNVDGQDVQSDGSDGNDTDSKGDSNGSGTPS